MRIQSLSAREDELFLIHINMRLFQLTRPYYLYAVEYRRSWKTCLASRLKGRLEGEKGKRSDFVSPFYSSHLPPSASPTPRLPSLVFKRSKREGWGYVSPFYFSFYFWFDILPKMYFKKDTWLVVSDVACERQTFLLAHRRWGTFREEERLRLSDRNSTLMTQNLSGIWAEGLIGQRSSFIVLAIVYERQTKDKRPRRSKENAMKL